jgi:hypothetical protein
VTVVLLRGLNDDIIVNEGGAIDGVGGDDGGDRCKRTIPRDVGLVALVLVLVGNVVDNDNGVVIYPRRPQRSCNTFTQHL